LYGLRPKPGNKFVYVTTDIKRAEKYAKAWTAAILTNYKEDKNFRKKFKDSSFSKHEPQEGLILKIRIKKSLLEQDPYNPEGEPNQYRVRDKISISKIKDWKYIKFDDMVKNKTELLTNYSYWIGVARATDE
jgi:hypothetical protein